MLDTYLLTKGNEQFIVVSKLIKVGLNSYHRPIYKREIVLQYPIPQGVDGSTAMQLAKKEGII